MTTRQPRGPTLLAVVGVHAALLLALASLAAPWHRLAAAEAVWVQLLPGPAAAVTSVSPRAEAPALPHQPSPPTPPRPTEASPPWPAPAPVAPAVAEAAVPVAEAAVPVAEAAVPVAVAPPPTAPTAPAAPPAVSPPPPVVAGPVATPPPRQLDIRSVSYRQPPRLLYPPAARRLLEEGTALVRVLVDTAGTPERVELLRSSGHARLDEAALAAARLARFHPHTEDGRALPFWVVMPLLFELD